MKNLNIVILAAGKGERMLSRKPKVMHEIMGKPMISYAVERAQELSPHKIVVVVGYGKEAVQAYLKNHDVEFSVQTTQGGTAHAVLTAERLIKGRDILILYGDVPLMTANTLKKFFELYQKTGQITFITTDVDNPKGYGRVIMKGKEIKRIVEEIEATEEEKKIRRINTGICIIPWQHFSLLKTITPDNRKGEYYLTDICSIAHSRKIPIRAYHYPEASEVLGINTRKELLDANIHMKNRILDRHMENGVTLLDRSIYIEPTVQIGRDTTISSQTFLMGKTIIGENVQIGPNTVIKDSLVHSNVTIEGFVVIEGIEVKEGARVGFFEWKKTLHHKNRKR